MSHEHNRKSDNSPNQVYGPALELNPTDLRLLLLSLRLFEKLFSTELQDGWQLLLVEWSGTAGNQTMITPSFIYIYIYIYIYKQWLHHRLYIYIYIYIYTHTHTHTIHTRGVNRMVRHDSIWYRFSYPAILYLPIPQKIIRFRSISINNMILYTYFKQPSIFLLTHKCNQKYITWT